MKNYVFGTMQKGEKNLITDVPGVRVGHCTLADRDVQTGVTVILPHGGDLYHEKCPAASHVVNGYGKSTGLMQINELGSIETPIILTNTFGVGSAFTACVQYMAARNDGIGRDEGTVNPVVLECNDSFLNDIRGLARTGGITGGGSGEVVVAFSTANRMISYEPVWHPAVLNDALLDPLFRAATETVEEGIIRSMLEAERVTGLNGNTRESLRDLIDF